MAWRVGERIRVLEVRAAYPPQGLHIPELDC